MLDAHEPRCAERHGALRAPGGRGQAVRSLSSLTSAGGREPDYF